MEKVNTYYVAVLENGNKYRIRFSDISRINPNAVLGCVVYEDDCALYYNEGHLSKEQLLNGGFDIVKEVAQVVVYEDEITIYKA